MRSSLSRSPRRGAVLIVALIFAAGIAISLGSFLRLSTTASQLSYRSFFAGSAMNAAETGLEFGMWSVNKALAGESSAAWSGWTGSPHAQRTFDLGTLSGGARSQVKVYVNRRDLSGEPFIVSRSIITPPNGATSERWIKVTLKKRSRYASGLVAKDTIRFSGNNASVDSWDSEPPDGSGPVPYSTAVRKDNGSVGSVLIENPSIFTNNADIWGSASTGGTDPTTNVGSNGSILGADSATKDKSSWIKINVDPDRIATDFTADFEVQKTPIDGTTLTAITTNHTLVGSNNFYAPTVYRIPYISLNGNELFKITGHVSIVLTNTTGEALSITGNAGMQIDLGASLRIYSSADIKIAGNGVANLNPQPKTLMVYGTATDSDNNSSTTHQTINIAGNGDLKAIVDAPNATTNINGNGNVMGSVISGKINITGNAAFHYDESLGRLDSGEPLGLHEWNEFVTFADRQVFGSIMNF